MNKFKFTFKITGLEFQMEGNREDVGTITNSLGQHFAGMVQPIGAIAEVNSDKSQLTVTEDGELTDVKSRKPRKRNTASKNEKIKAYDFKNDPLKYCSPIQSWTTLEKSIWLLYVVKNELSVEELSAREIAETFNKHFKQQGSIRATNVSRDYGKQKAGSKALLGENATSTPSRWYLTEEGTKAAQKLIQSLKEK